LSTELVGVNVVREKEWLESFKVCEVAFGDHPSFVRRGIRTVRLLSL
jgi:hypothetical protein